MMSGGKDRYRKVSLLWDLKRAKQPKITAGELIHNVEFKGGLVKRREMALEEERWAYW